MSALAVLNAEVKMGVAMAILDRFENRKIKDVGAYVHTMNHCGQDVLDLFEAVDVLTEALTKLTQRRYPLRHADRDKICWEALEKVWGSDG